MKKLLFLFMFPIICFGQYTSIPDQNFEQAFIDFGYDDVIDGKELTANINSVDSLFLEDKNISDLIGVEALTNENNSYYECSPPYNKKISNIDALSFESFRDSIGDDGNQGIDKDGNAVLAKDLNYYLPDEINSFGFVENWFFDKKNSSFGKEVNGISLEVSGVINYVENVIKPIFLIKN